jgi:glyoxylase-like metal-dependent hydrolase (beta-lactamase superfamily II)
LNKAVREVAKEIFLIRLPMPFRLTHVNVFLFLEKKGFTLIDTGPNLPGVLPALEEALSQAGLTLEECRRIFITHFHMDHCGLAGLIKERSGAAISLSEIDAQTIRTFALDDGRVWRMEAFCIEHGLDKATIGEIASTFTSFEQATLPFTADSHLSDGEQLVAGDRELRVVATPGHSRGHLSFYLPAERALISGDHILPHITPNLSPDLIDPKFHPLESFLDSMTKVEELEIETIWPSHGRPFTNLRGRIADVRKHHAERSLLAFQALDEGAKTARQVSQFIFGNSLPVFDRLLALNESYVHLVTLEKRGLIGRRRTGGGLCFFEHLPR